MFANFFNCFSFFSAMRLIDLIALNIIGSYFYDAYNKKRAENLALKIANKFGGLILDAGGGNALKKAFYPNVIVCDLKPKKKWVKYCDVEKLSNSFSSKFSVVVLSHVLEHLNDPLKAIKEAHKIGKFVIIVTPKLWQLPNWLNPSHKWIVYKKDNQLIFENYLKKRKIVYNLRKNDFVF